MLRCSLLPQEENQKAAAEMVRQFWCKPIPDLPTRCACSLLPRPRPPGEGKDLVSCPDPALQGAREGFGNETRKGLVTIARFLVCAESAVLFSRQPIRLLGLKISCDKESMNCRLVP